MAYRYQYDEDYHLMEESNMFFHFLDYEEEEAFARQLNSGKWR